ncbi:hypothetical protein BGAL_0019g00340 [Botrytis galanthina]|uniref:Uncharacterized protein n=1 Tax=Botrytis galanthina TaxID=278940 RepID=A0A4S8R9P0_9HELO|nr:hypothetical protein BGAL_0019g00340 [Botrytis galanthina]
MSLWGKASLMLCVSINYHPAISFNQASTRITFTDLTYGRANIGDSTSAPAGSKSQTNNAESVVSVL